MTRHTGSDRQGQGKLPVYLEEMVKNKNPHEREGRRIPVTRAVWVLCILTEGISTQQVTNKSASNLDVLDLACTARWCLVGDFTAALLLNTQYTSLALCMPPSMPGNTNGHCQKCLSSDSRLPHLLEGSVFLLTRRVLFS